VGDQPRLHRSQPWYARCDETDRPDFLHFDLDPVDGAGFDRVRETALVVRDALAKLDMRATPRHRVQGDPRLCAIERGPVQKEVWELAKALAFTLAERHPGLITPSTPSQASPGHVLVDYNQNAWAGPWRRSTPCARALAPRHPPRSPGRARARVEIDDFRLDNLPERVARLGICGTRAGGEDRVSLDRFVGARAAARVPDSPIARA